MIASQLLGVMVAPPEDGHEPRVMMDMATAALRATAARRLRPACCCVAGRALLEGFPSSLVSLLKVRSSREYSGVSQTGLCSGPLPVGNRHVLMRNKYCAMRFWIQVMCTSNQANGLARVMFTCGRS